MTSRWANPVNNNILRDLQNNVLTGGSLEFYEAGTSTPLAVYSDSALTVSLGSTLTADAYGLIEDFHMAAGTEYKMIAKDSGGTTKWTRDEVFSLDSAVDTRLDSLETTINNLAGSTNNVILNSSCQVQRDGVSAPTIDTAFQQGTVLGHYFKATNVSAGTITRGTTTSINAAYYVHCSGVTTTDSASTVVGQYRVSAGDVSPFVSSSGIFTCQVYQDTGGNVNYTVTIKKADAENDFSALTTISTSSATSVSTGTWTSLSYSNAALGDCRNGLVIEVSAACGVQTTKNYYFAEPQFETGTTASGWGSGKSDVEEVGLKLAGFPISKGYINGLELSLDAETDHDVNVTAGACRDDNDEAYLWLQTEITKQIDATWAAGDDAGGMASTDHPVANWTTYYLYLISKDSGDTVDMVFATTSAKALADTGYDHARLLGAVWTDGSANIQQVINKQYVGQQREQYEFTANYTGGWTVPSFVSAIDAVIVGAGGGGQGSGGGGSAGGDSVFDSFTAGGGSGGSGTGGAGGTPSFTFSQYVTYYASGQHGNDGVIYSGEGAENGLFATPLGDVTNVNAPYPTITGGAAQAAGTKGGGGGAQGGGSGGGAGGAAIRLSSYPVSGSVTVTVGTGGAGGGGTAAAGGDGFVVVRF